MEPGIQLSGDGQMALKPMLLDIGGPKPSAPTQPPAIDPAAARAAMLRAASIRNTQATIDEIPGLFEAAIEAERQNRANTKAQFDAQERQQRETYDDSLTTNQMNYDSNFMDSIRSGIRGLGSLVNLLRGTGAVGGTAEDAVRDTVGGITSNDIREGADTQKSNQVSLDSALTTFLTELKGKRQTADDTFENNQRAIRRESNTQLQDLYSKMAGYYGDGGDVARANEFMERAGGLTPKIASDSRTMVSSYDTTPVVVEAPQLTAFAAPSQPEVATAPKDGQIGTGIFTMNRRRTDRQSPTPAAAPVGA